ncbi:tetraacyldisaccharide 4'-kinase [Camelimonas fluminis]|uniref:Tetraacyldisaccharide 4'-kinase n=1 Tax=Camelimonas fluminis TaxID=1576911 RepID=A0ABV7UCS8_9HYPH|nr:tetraacyldisaccharide 4'-kinase [Camelimonas fluminis]GHE47205.1 tetraacyldisaccharide 4'-kinase [Camelimonas fluminis]
MRAPGFWQQRNPGLPARLAMALLAPVAAIYGGVTARRMARPGGHAGIPVICVGNFVAGGAGKTPTALSIAAHLARRGLRPAFVSRGYGGALSGHNSVTRIDPAVHDARLAGDEPLLLAASAATFVARDRLAGALAAAQAGADVIILDDGLQNPALHKDLVLAVVDGAVGVGNGRVVPAGPLRAPLPAQWPSVHAVVVIGPGEAGEALARGAQARGKPVLRAALRPDADVAAHLAGRRVLALAGIGRPEKFVATLREVGAEVVDLAAFGDHHPYSVADLAPLAARAAREGLALVTTAKDGARMAGDLGLAPMLTQMTVLPVTLAFADDAALDALLAGVLGG